MRLTEKAQDLVAAVVQPGEIVIDATAGNGHDTLFLALLVGCEGEVYAFDIQAEALAATQQRLDAASENPIAPVKLIRDCHSNMAIHVPSTQHGRIATVMFNLGYLPGGDHLLRTQQQTSLAAISIALQLLRPRGILTVAGYVGHAGGREETAAVERLLRSQAPAEFSYLEGLNDGLPDAAPRLMVVRKAGQSDDSSIE